MSMSLMDAPIPPPCARDSAALVRRIAPLELLHPDGVAPRGRVLGGNCPAPLRPAVVARDGGSVDLVVLAPTAAECRTKGWLKAAVRALAQHLAADGVAYVAVPPQWRAHAAWLLHREGLIREAAFVHVPMWAASRHLVPLQSRIALYAFSRVVPLRPWRGRVITLLFRLPGCARVLSGMLPGVGLVARRRTARPLGAWLFALEPDASISGGTVISLSTREQKGTAVLFRFARGAARPAVVAKCALTAVAGTDRIAEAARLELHAPAARAAGARVPEATLARAGTGHHVLLQRVLDGQMAATILAEHPARLPVILGRCARWLATWNNATAVIKHLDPAWLERELLAPAAQVAPFLERGEDYLGWLADRCDRVAGRPLPLVATHNDLTMRNVLVDRRDRLGIVDWESAAEDGLPLVDFLYAAADAVAATRRYTDRTGAFVVCFEPGGAHTRLVEQSMARLCAAVDLPDGIADLCIQACWLRHAANEQRKALAGDARPFLAIVQRVAARRGAFMSHPDA